MADIVVEPKSTPPSVTPTEPSTQPPESKSGASDELLQIPAIQAVFAGAPPAVSTSLKDFGNRPEAKLIGDNRDELQSMGIGFYRSLGGDLGVLFNQLRLSGQDLVNADKEGRLQEIAPPFDTINSEVATSGDKHPSLSASAPTGGATAAPTPPAPMPTPNTQPASVQNKQATARLKNVQPGAPTSGPVPGAGRIMNAILKPVV
jgi:hypothetical protein